ncbi:MAG: di-heme-cytochrome C peroxidase [Pseudomonadota bacterium]
MTDGRPGAVRRLIGGVAGLTLGQIIKWVLVIGVVLGLVAGIGFAVFVLAPVSSIPAYEPVDEIVYLGQGWGRERGSQPRQTYYYTPQGTSLPQGETVNPLRYQWFVNLELPFSRERFADPDHLRRYRFLVDSEPTPANPDLLPVGFTRHFNPLLGEDVLDLTCAACHSGEIHYAKGGKRYALRIDGGQAMHAFTDMSRGNFGPVLLASLIATYTNPFKFSRFAEAVIGPNYPEGKGQLRSQLGRTIGAFLKQGQNNPLRHLYPMTEGFGRTDALGRIANTVFGDHLVPANYEVSDAPVSFPYVWNIWKFDWVQYTGSVNQPLARNVGEALGVGAMINLTNSYGSPVPEKDRFTSSVDIRDLVKIERTLQQLTPPEWPEDILGPVDPTLAEDGKRLFQDLCQHCHGPHVATQARQEARAPGKSGPSTEWQIPVIPVSEIGTDAASAKGFVERRYDLTPAGITNQQVANLVGPLLDESLRRNGRYRLREVLARREQAELAVGQLPALVAAYPLPKETPPGEVDQFFAQIAAALDELLPTPPEAHADQPPPDTVVCELDCQTEHLYWLTTQGRQHANATLAAVDTSQVSLGQGLNIVGLMIKNRFFEAYGVTPEEKACIQGFGILDLPQVVDGYKPRPLEGVWSTPPFLHNGSVPSLYHMLLPPEDRPSRFFVGRQEYDPRHAGYVSEPLEGTEDHGFWFDASLPGNRNLGHGFTANPDVWEAHRQDPDANPLPGGVIGPLLSDEQRWALVEYLKIHRDEPGTPADFEPTACGPWH